MEQTLKQRLIGIVVLTALAAIFVPMMFDDPVAERDKVISEFSIPPEPITEYEQEIPPAPENVEEVLVLPEQGYIMAESELEDINAQPFDGDEDFAEQKAVSQQTVQSVQQKIAIDKTVPALQRWVIQVASLGAEKNAQALRDTLQKEGFHAYYEKFTTSNNKIMFRVHVGPMLKEQDAQQLKPKIDKLHKVDSRIIKE